MSYPFRYILIMGVVAILLAATEGTPLKAQNRAHSEVRTAGTVTNLFHTLDPTDGVEAVRLTFPDAWDLKRVHLLRYGTEPIPITVQRRRGDGTFFFTVAQPIQGPHELVLRVRIPRLEGTYNWQVVSLARTSSVSDSSAEPSFRQRGQATKRVSVRPPPSVDRTNRALNLADAAAPVVVRGEQGPTARTKGAFTIEFWMLTNGLDEVVLSAWTGDESEPYPAEFVVDRSGRLRFYSGEPGNHRALRSGKPVADGAWHHVAVVYDHAASEVRLVVDGSLADSSTGYVTPAPDGLLPFALGGRLNHASDDSVFSGRLDEIRVWNMPRSVSTVRRARSRAFTEPVGEERGQRLVRLGFETASDSRVKAWPDGARRVPSSLTFRSGLRRFQAHTEGEGVTLEWAMNAAEVHRFVVERSSEGRSFSELAVLEPSDVKQPTASDRPAFAYTDENVDGTVVFYRVRTVHTNGSERTSGTIKIGLGPESEKKETVNLVGNFPNPFTESTTIAYEIRQPQPIAVTVWDLAGHRIATLIDGEEGSGYHEVPFDAADLPSGTYFVRLETPTGTQSHRMVVLK